MGNKYCYQSGKKFENMLKNILNKTFDPTQASDHGQIKELLEYLENDFSKLPKIPSFVRDHLKKKSGHLDLNSQNMLLNSFQLFLFIIQSAVKLNNSRNELMTPLSETKKIKMEVHKSNILERLHMEKFIFKKSKKSEVNSQFLINFLPFQERVFKIIQSIFSIEYKSMEMSTYSANFLQLMKFILEYFGRTFQIWSVFGLKNFSSSVQEIFEIAIKKSKIFIKDDSILEKLGDIFSSIPFKMYQLTQYAIRELLECVFLEKSDKSLDVFNIMIKKLLENLLRRNKQQIILDTMNYFSQQRRKMVDVFINASIEQKELELIILDFLVEKIQEDGSYLPMLITLLKKCSLDLINTTNFNKMTDYLFEMISKDVPFAVKNEFFMILFEKCQKNIHIGRYSFFKNIFIKVKGKKCEVSGLCQLIKNCPLSIVDGLRDHDTIDRIFLKLIYEVISYDSEFLDIFIVLLESDRERIERIGLKDMNSDMFAKLELELKSFPNETGISGSQFIFFTKLIKIMILEQSFLGEDNYYKIKYVILFIKLLEKVNSLLIFLFYIVVLFQFEKKIGKSEKLIDIMQKYDPLLEKPTILSAFKLLDSNISETDIEANKILKNLKKENFFQTQNDFKKDIFEISLILKKDWNLSQNNFSVDFLSRLNESRHNEFSGRPDETSSGHQTFEDNVEMNDSLMLTECKNFDEAFKLSLETSLKKADFRKQITKIGKV